MTKHNVNYHLRDKQEGMVEAWEKAFDGVISKSLWEYTKVYGNEIV